MEERTGKFGCFDVCGIHIWTCIWNVLGTCKTLLKTLLSSGSVAVAIIS